MQTRLTERKREKKAQRERERERDKHRERLIMLPCSTQQYTLAKIANNGGDSGSGFVSYLDHTRLGTDKQTNKKSRDTEERNTDNEK